MSHDDWTVHRARGIVDLWPEPMMVVQVLNHALIDRFGNSKSAAKESRDDWLGNGNESSGGGRARRVLSLLQRWGIVRYMKGGAVGVRRTACVAKYARRAGTRRKRGVVGLRIENWTERTDEFISWAS